MAATGSPTNLFTFVVGSSTRLAVDHAWVTEVADAVPLAPLPLAPDHVEGIAQVRGRPVPVVDLARFFGLPGDGTPDDDARSRLLLVAAAGMEVALTCRAVLFEALPPSSGEGMAFGERLAAHAVAHVDSRKGPAVLVDLPSVLEAARVRR